MQAKAHFAQYLIQEAWDKTLADRQPHKPWYWADTHPVAKLSFLPRADSHGGESAPRGESLFVLSGASGRNLAFGPGLMLASAKVEEAGNTVIAGHRDTHFAILSEVHKGRRLLLQGAAGEETVYEVTHTRVVHESDTRVLSATQAKTLTLITCYPFEALSSGGSLRFIVQASPLGASESRG